MINQPTRLIFLLFTGHVGSSWLLSLLCSHPRIRQLGFEPVDELSALSIDAAPFIEKILSGESINTFPSDVQQVFRRKFENENLLQNSEWDDDDSELPPFIAFKARYSPKLQQSLFSDLLPQAKPVVIYLRRRNKIKNALSQFKRTQLKISHLNNFENTPEKLMPVEVDTSYLSKQAIQFTRRELIAKNYFELLRNKNDLLTHEVFYEDLLQHKYLKHFIDRFFSDLGLEAMAVNTKYQKMTSDNLQEAVSNFDELCTEFADTIFAPNLLNDDYDIVESIYSNELDTSLIKLAGDC
jgi:hypothetical protein